VARAWSSPFYRGREAVAGGDDRRLMVYTIDD
jgi:hypothetical protein